MSKQDVSEVTTVNLVKYLTEVDSPFTVQEIQDELSERVVPHDDADIQMRGGIRPTRPQ